MAPEPHSWEIVTTVTKRDIQRRNVQNWEKVSRETATSAGKRGTGQMSAQRVWAVWKRGKPSQ